MKKYVQNRSFKYLFLGIFVLHFSTFSFAGDRVYVDFITSQSGCQPFKCNFYPKLRYQDSIHPPAISAYEWDFGDGSPHSFDINPVHIYQVQPGSVKQKFSVQLTVTSNFLHYDTLKQNWISVAAKPRPAIVASPTVTTIANPTIQFNTDTVLSSGISFNDSNTSYSWSLKDNTNPFGSVFAAHRSTQYTYRDTGNYTIILKVISNGCEGADSVTLFVGPELLVFIPDVFKPNGIHTTAKGIHYFSLEENETFSPVISYCTDFQMDIFNRSGEQLFHSDNVKTGWDGKYNGLPVPDDTYVYVISLKNSIGKSYNYRGMVTLLK